MQNIENSQPNLSISESRQQRSTRIAENEGIIDHPIQIPETTQQIATQSQEAQERQHKSIADRIAITLLNNSHLLSLTSCISCVASAIYIINSAILEANHNQLVQSDISAPMSTPYSLKIPAFIGNACNTALIFSLCILLRNLYYDDYSSEEKKDSSKSQRRQDENKKEQHQSIVDRIENLLLKRKFIFPLMLRVFSETSTIYQNQVEIRDNPLIKSDVAATMNSSYLSKIPIFIMSASGVAIVFSTAVLLRSLYFKKFESESEQTSSSVDPQSITHDPNIESIGVNDSILQNTDI